MSIAWKIRKDAMWIAVRERRFRLALTILVMPAGWALYDPRAAGDPE